MELQHPVLLSTLAGLDEIVYKGNSVEFKHVFYTWIAMGILFILGLLVRRRLTLIARQAAKRHGVPHRRP